MSDTLTSVQDEAISRTETQGEAAALAVFGRRSVLDVVVDRLLVATKYLQYQESRARHRAERAERSLLRAMDCEVGLDRRLIARLERDGGGAGVVAARR